MIYDTDFHSPRPEERQSRQLDIANKRTAPVRIGDNAFIGAHATILKGVSIGRGAVIGACSLVTRDVPDGEIWAGNPAIKIRALEL